MVLPRSRAHVQYLHLGFMRASPKSTFEQQMAVNCPANLLKRGGQTGSGLGLSLLPLLFFFFFLFRIGIGSFALQLKGGAFDTAGRQLCSEIMRWGDEEAGAAPLNRAEQR